MNELARSRANRRRRRGFTLIELTVGVFIALFLTAAAVAFASHETRLLGYSNEQIDLAQASRAAIDMLSSDLQLAGAGVGYTASGVFAGLVTRDFQVPSGPSGGPALGFNDAGGMNHLLTLTTATSYTVPTQDLKIRVADGSSSTIAYWNGNGGEYCMGPGIDIRAGDQVILRESGGIDAMAGTITPGGVVSCSWGKCIGGCRQFTFIPPAPSAVLAYRSSDSAPSTPYTGGEIAGNFKEIVWFVETMKADRNAAQLRRVVFDGTNGCPGTRLDCGEANSVADYVESLAYQVWEYDTTRTSPDWVALASNRDLKPNGRGDRLRIDFELVLRSRVADDRQHTPIALRLAPPQHGGLCIPGGGVASVASDPSTCPGAPDTVARKVLRTSVEIMNSGRAQF